MKNIHQCSASALVLWPTGQVEHWYQVIHFNSLYCNCVTCFYDIFVWARWCGLFTIVLKSILFWCCCQLWNAAVSATVVLSSNLNNWLLLIIFWLIFWRFWYLVRFIKYLLSVSALILCPTNLLFALDLSQKLGIMVNCQFIKELE